MINISEEVSIEEKIPKVNVKRDTEDIKVEVEKKL